LPISQNKRYFLPRFAGEAKLASGTFIVYQKKPKKTKNRFSGRVIGFCERV
jgi:hypothetical protein